MRALLVVVASAAALGCGSDYGGDGDSQYGAPAPAPATCTAATATPTTSISLSPGNRFEPACARVPPGVAVTFTNRDGVELHTVTTDAGQAQQFDSGTLSPGMSFTHAFPAPGTVQLHCGIHPEMRATVFVQ